MHGQIEFMCKARTPREELRENRRWRSMANDISEEWFRAIRVEKRREKAQTPEGLASLPFLQRETYRVPKRKEARFLYRSGLREARYSYVPHSSKPKARRIKDVKITEAYDKTRRIKVKRPHMWWKLQDRKTYEYNTPFEGAARRRRMNHEYYKLKRSKELNYAYVSN